MWISVVHLLQGQHLCPRIGYLFWNLTVYLSHNSSVKLFKVGGGILVIVPLTTFLWPCFSIRRFLTYTIIVWYHWLANDYIVAPIVWSCCICYIQDLVFEYEGATFLFQAILVWTTNTSSSTSRLSILSSLRTCDSFLWSNQSKSFSWCYTFTRR